MQCLALEYLRFADGLEKSRQQRREDEFREQLLEFLVKGSLVSSGNYEEKVLFPQYFSEETAESSGSGQGDAEVDFDYSGVDFGTPDEDEMAVLARMLSDDTVSISGESLTAPEPEEEPKRESSLPPPKAFDPADIEHDSEWV